MTPAERAFTELRRYCADDDLAWLLAQHVLWAREKHTGFLRFNYGNGRMKDVSRDTTVFPPGGRKSAPRGTNGGPLCPSCGKALTSRDAGAIWTCDPCRVKRTKAQLTKEAG